MNTMIMPVVGNKIKAVRIPLITGTESDEFNNYTGQIVTITRIEQRTWSDDGTASNTMTVPYGRFLMNGGGTQEFFMAEWEPVYEDTAETPADPELTEDQRTIAALKTTIGDLQDMIRKLTHDIEVVIGETINEEADNRGWCDMFDSLVIAVNNRLTGSARLPERMQEFEVDREVSGIVSTIHTVMVMARSQDDADEMVDDCPSDYFDAESVLSDYLSWNSFDSIEVNPA
jgi:hypothetical protein